MSTFKFSINIPSAKGQAQCNMELPSDVLIPMINSDSPQQAQTNFMAFVAETTATVLRKLEEGGLVRIKVLVPTWGRQSFYIQRNQPLRDALQTLERLTKSSMDKLSLEHKDAFVPQLASANDLALKEGDEFWVSRLD